MMPNRDGESEGMRRGRGFASSVAALLVSTILGGMLTLGAVSPALAVCSDNAPAADGQVVTCNTNAPDPDRNGVFGNAGVDDVDVTVLPGAAIVNNDGGGIYAEGSGWTVTNRGAISGNPSGTEWEGIFLGRDGAVVNEIGATVTGGDDGVRILAGAGDVTNSGTIVSSSANGVSIFDGNVSNNADALIDGKATGVILFGNGTVDNAGLVRGQDHEGVSLLTGGSVINRAGGTIRGGASGSNVDGSQDAVRIAGGAGKVVNSGTIRSGTQGGTVDESAGVRFLAGGTLINEASGEIRGRDHAIFSAGGPVEITNRGILGGQGAIRIENGGTVTNEAGGTITTRAAPGIDLFGIYNAVALGGGGNIVNRGTIESGPAAAILAEGDVTILNGPGALIQSQESNGVIQLSSRLDLINAGIIESLSPIGSGDGVVVAGTAVGTITNQAGGRIVGASAGVTGGGLEVTNAGEIAGGDGFGVNAGSVLNQAGAVITGAGGVNTATLDNAGRIEGVGGGGVSLGMGVQIFGGGSVINRAGGEIIGNANGGFAVDVLAGGTVENAGLIRGAGPTGGVQIGGGTAATNSVTNLSGGTISGEGFHGVRLSDGGTIVNHGTIVGSGFVGGSGVFGGGATIVGGGTLINTGTITADQGFAATLSDGGTVENSGTISDSRTADTPGLSAGLSFQGGLGGTVRNTGTISSVLGPALVAGSRAADGSIEIINADGAAIVGGEHGISGGGGDLRITNHGRIASSDPVKGTVSISRSDVTLINTGAIENTDGDLAILLLGDYSQTFRNAGTVIGNVLLDLGDDEARLTAGHRLSGLLDGGGGRDRLVLEGGGNATLDVATVLGFETAEKVDAGAWTLTGSNAAFAPEVAIRAGTLSVDGAVPGTVFAVGGGAVLAGTGTTGGVVADNGGTVSPGNSIGTLTVAGGVTFDAGSVYAVEIEPGGASDLLAVTGDGTVTIIGGTVEVTALPPDTSYVDGQNFTIITTEAANGVTGVFDDLTINSASLSPTLLYGGDFVRLSLAITAAFPDVAQTFNQREAASGLMDLTQNGDALTVFNELLFLPDADSTRRAFDLSSGEVHASGQHLLGFSDDLFLRTLRRQGASGTGLGLGVGHVSVAARGDGSSTAYTDEHAQQVWLAPLGQRGTVDSDRNAATLDWWTVGLAGGWHTGFDGGRGVAGFGLGYLRSGGTVDRRRSRLDVDGYHVGLNAAWSDGTWVLAGALAYAAHEVDTDRRIVFGGIDRTAEADYWSHSVGFAGEAAYRFDRGGTTVMPLVTLDTGLAWHNGFGESGAGALNLTGASESWTRFDTGLGAAVAHSFAMEGGELTLEGRAVWEHAFADVLPYQDMALAGSPTGFDVRGPGLDRDRLRTGLDLAFKTGDSLTFRARYEGVFSGDQQSHAGTLGLSIAF